MATPQEHLAVIILNFGKVDDTIACLESFQEVKDVSYRLYVLDNGSSQEDLERLRSYVACNETMQLLRSETNLGFSGGANFALQTVLQNAQNTHILFLNNDTTVQPDALAKLLAACNPAEMQDLVGLRMMSFYQPNQVDNLGIAMYASCIASSRKTLDATFFGPSGGSMLVTRRFAEHMLHLDGEFFDSEFFAYAEDTDICFRALHRGYTPVYVDDAVVMHKGSVTSGGKFNEFVMYQGLRNTIWMLMKNLPAGIFWSNIFWIFLAHVSVMLKYTIKGKLGLTIRLYRDAFAARKLMGQKRKKIFANRKRTNKELRVFMGKQFYEGAYITTSLRTLFRRDIAPSALLKTRI